jgi:hypothetical protein
VWIENFAPTSALKAWLNAGKVVPIGSFVTEEVSITLFS